VPFLNSAKTHDFPRISAILRWNITKRDEKIIFSVNSYLLWSILLLSSPCILHHSLRADEVPTFDSKRTDAELNSVTGTQE